MDVVGRRRRTLLWRSITVVGCTVFAAALSAASPLAAGELPLAEIATLSSPPITAELLQLDDKTLSYRQAGQDGQVPLAEVLSLKLASSLAIPAADSADPSIEVNGTDGSRLRVTSIESLANNKLRLVHPQLGELDWPLRRVSSIRFGVLDGKVESAFRQLLAKRGKKDQLVLRKGDTLDHLTGVLGRVDAAGVKFLLDGDELTVKRERIFALLYAQKDPETVATSDTLVPIELASGERLQVRKLRWSGTAWTAEQAGGGSITIPPEVLRTADFSQGKLQYLSDLEPRDVKYTWFFGDSYGWFEYRRDTNVDRRPLNVQGQTYEKGLAIHSKTLLRYRLSGDFRRLQLVAAINDESNRVGDVNFVITADGKVLGRYHLTYDSPALPLDLEIRGVNDLELLVDFGADEYDIGDWLHLGDARLLK